MEKIRSIIEISELIALDISGQLSQPEKDSLEEWLNSSERNKKLYRKIKNSNNLAERNKLYKSIDIERAWNEVSDVLDVQRRKQMLQVFFKYAAAILIPILIGGTAYWYLNNRPQKTIQIISKIQPYTNNAVLVMANGENVNLASYNKRNLLEKDGTVIRNTSKELNYADQAAKNSKKILLNTLFVPKGGEYRLVLSDGTRIFVNSMSKLVFPVTLSGNKREIMLEGEAYFEVAKDKTKPFIVSVKGIKVEVLGTSFNIKAYPDENLSYTTLVEGKVKLNPVNQSSNNHFLEPDHQAVFDPSTATLVIKNVDASKVVLWTKGQYAFTDQTLDEIMKTLSRWYDFNYQFKDETLKEIRFEGGLNKYESIEPIIDIINKTGKVKVSVKGKEILFSKI